ncbi:MAG: hypothetical protein DRP79_06635, partial [Planctomycetota bacterium]
MDEDEEGTDCGGEDCLACQGAACDADPGTPECEPDHSLCLSGYCNPVTCQCENPPEIGQSCAISGTCSPDNPCQDPYVCVDFDSSGDCACCCENDSHCPEGLVCDTSQDCGTEKGVCCGCSENSECGRNNVCDSTTHCCKSCQGQSNGTKCYVPGLPNDEGECCNGVCCYGQCEGGQCVNLCGNGRIDPGEECDGNELGGKTCEDFDDYTGGQLSCNPDCTFNFSDCEREEGPRIGEECNSDEDCFPPGTLPEKMIGAVCYNNKCIAFPKPEDLEIISSTLNKIKLKWRYQDPYSLATAFEIYEKGPTDTSFGSLTTCYLENFQCHPDMWGNFIFEKQGENYIFTKNGTFEKGQKYSYKIRAKKGTQTAYSDYSNEATGEIKGLIRCQSNDDCPLEAPCCRTDTHQCVIWDYCEGNCTEGGNCHPPEEKYALANFRVLSGEEMGACLFSVEPEQGRINDYVNLSGALFGNNGEVKFEDSSYHIEGNAGTPWSDEEITTSVPYGLNSGQGRVWVNPQGRRSSNKLPFKIILEEGSSGEECKLEGIAACSDGVDSCQTPFECLANDSNQDCRCCCNPNTPGQCGDLECYPNISPCDGNSRGLCCGCQSDSQCLSGGCGMLDPNHCCWPRPIIENRFPLAGSTVCRNPVVVVRFDQEMDRNSFNKENIIWKEVTPIKETNIEFDILIDDDNYGFSLYPKNCLLDPNHQYHLQIKGGSNGEGIRSVQGVSFQTQDWDFYTNDQICAIDRIEVSPEEEILYHLGDEKAFSAVAYSSENIPVCVDEFNWSSSNTNIAEITTPGLIATATAKEKGEVTITASHSGKSGNASLTVAPSGPQVIEQKGCEVCGMGGQSPSPFKNSTDACRNAAIVAQFNQEIESSSLANKFLVYQCDGESFDNLDCHTPVNGRRKLNFTFLATFIPNSPLAPNTFYKAVLKSGDNGIKNTNGYPLDGNFNNKDDGSPADDYVWYFKTSSEENCLLDKVCVEPNDIKITHSSNQTFRGEIYAENCNRIGPANYDWQWSLESIEPWIFSDVANIQQLPQEWKAVVNSVGLGEV